MVHYRGVRYLFFCVAICKPLKQLSPSKNATHPKAYMNLIHRNSYRHSTPSWIRLQRFKLFTPSGHHPYWDYWIIVRHVLYKPRHLKVIAYHRLNVQNETKLREILYHVSHRWDALVDASSHERILDDLAEFRRSTHLSPFTFAPRTGVVCCRLDS